MKPISIFVHCAICIVCNNSVSRSFLFHSAGFSLFLFIPLFSLSFSCGFLSLYLALSFPLSLFISLASYLCSFKFLAVFWSFPFSLSSPASYLFIALAHTRIHSQPSQPARWTTTWSYCNLTVFSNECYIAIFKVSMHSITSQLR